MNRLLPCFFLLLTFLSCSKDNVIEPEENSTRKVEVVLNDIPFPTETNLRICYTLKMWEFEKEGLSLEEILILDSATKNELMKISKEELPIIYKEPLGQNPYFTIDKISGYYLSIQLPILLDQPKPSKVFHRFTFRNTSQNKIVTVEGGEFSPRLNEKPLAISSPVKGKNWLFINQSTMNYHFYVLIFTEGKMYTGERFAFDNLRINDSYTNIYEGDSTKNSSYFNYKDTLYAVADGKVVVLKDGRPENNGNATDVTFTKADELGGNYLILDIGGGNFACYAHCVPNSFMVTQGSIVKEGDPIALLGNSGNSDAPHLHFQICDKPDILFSNGIPFVLKEYTKSGDGESGPLSPVKVTSAMMEQWTVISFE